MSAGLAGLIVGLSNTLALIVVGWWQRSTHKAVTPNGGASVADVVARIENKVDQAISAAQDISGRVDELADDVTRKGRRIEAAHRRIDRLGNNDR